MAYLPVIYNYNSFNSLKLAEMASVLHGSTANLTRFCETRATCFPLLENRDRVHHISARGKLMSKSLFGNRESCFQGRGCKGVIGTIPRCSTSSDSNDESPKQEKTPFGYSRKDVLLIGVGVTALGFGLKSGLELVGVNPLQAGNVVQLVLVLGLTVGWISTYIFRVSNKEMTYAQQLRSYEKQVIEKRFDGLTEGEIIALLEQVEEEKRQLKSKQIK